MASQTEEKKATKTIPVTTEEIEVGYCGDCVYTWCTNRKKVLYCTLKFKGVRIFACKC